MKTANILKELKRVYGERMENSKRIKELALKRVDSALSEYQATIRNINIIKEQALSLGVSSMIQIKNDSQILDFIIYKAESDISNLSGISISDLKIKKYINENNKGNTEIIEDIEDFNNHLDTSINELYRQLELHINSRIEDSKASIKIKGSYYSQYTSDNNIEKSRIETFLNDLYRIVSPNTTISIDSKNMEIIERTTKEILGTFKVQKNGTLIINK